MKKLKLTLNEMVAYVSEHRSWLSSDDFEWFSRIKEFHSKNGFLSHKQKKILRQFAGRINFSLSHSQKRFATKRVSYQGHDKFLMGRGVPVKKRATIKLQDFDKMDSSDIEREHSKINAELTLIGKLFDGISNGQFKLTQDKLKQVEEKRKQLLDHQEKIGGLLNKLKLK